MHFSEGNIQLCKRTCVLVFIPLLQLPVLVVLFSYMISCSWTAYFSTHSLHNHLIVIYVLRALILKRLYLQLYTYKYSS